MRRPLLLCSALATTSAAVLLVLAAADLARGVLLPIGTLLGFVGLNALAGVILLGQRIVMERTSAMLSGQPVHRPGAAQAPADDVQTAIESSMQTLAWSIDARLIGLLEHLAPTSSKDPENPPQ